MNKEAVVKIIARALEINNDKLVYTSHMDEIDEWDSLGHLSILMQLDEDFKGKVSGLKSLAEAKTVSEICDILLEAKLIVG
jgi:acyl carrier protein|tara:strand:- start:123 stop:365 length:243 start_codon:yes stop_codon:yes gene_type:complete